MSSAMVAEQQAPFPTTLGFKRSTGFSPLPPAGAAARATPFQAAQPLSQQAKQLSDSTPPSSLAAQVRPSKFHNSTSGSSVSAAPEHVGWKGLLEISRTSGVSGVVGARSTDDDEGSSTRDTLLEVTATAHTNPAIRRLVKSVSRGLKACQEPEKASEGMGGTYFFVNENGRKVAILKPCDEEPLAPNNPKGYVGRALGDPGWKPTVRVGEAAMREVAAYLLDHDGFAKVPTSVLVRARHPIFCYNNRMSSVRASSDDLGSGAFAQPDGSVSPPPLPMKLGSLQEFVAHECDTSEMGSSRFSVSDVHRIGILDIRLFNTDRHAGNMLVRSSRESSANLSSRLSNDTLELIPIDHGFCLPETLEAPYFEWLHWPQALQPFSEEELTYIRNLDIEADKELLRKELPNLRPECLRVLELGTTLLKRGAEQGLTLFEIASAMTRPFGETDEEPSELEKICAQARHSMELHKIAEEGETSGSEYDDDDDEAEGMDEYELNGGGSSLEFDIEIHNDGQTDSTMQTNRAVGASMLGRALELNVKGSGNLMFPLDDDLAGKSRFVAARSPSQYSASSSSPMSSVDILGSIGMLSSETATTVTLSGMLSGGVAAPMMMLPESQSATTSFSRNMARSACATESFLLRRLKSRHQASALSKRRGHKSEGPKRPAAQAYPPPVLTCLTLDGCNVSFTEMDEQQWASFMEVVEDELGAALGSNRWKHSTRPYDSVASSCPRF